MDLEELNRAWMENLNSNQGNNSSGDDFMKQWFINKLGVIRVMNRCRARQGTVADQFKTWVESQVVPSIMETGQYIAGQERAIETPH